MATFARAWGSARRGVPKINLDLVAALRPVHDTDDKTLVGYDCENAAGDTVGRIETFEVPEAGAIVPDTRGTCGICGDPSDHLACVAIGGDPDGAELGDVACFNCLRRTPTERRAALTRRLDRVAGRARTLIAVLDAEDDHQVQP